MSEASLLVNQQAAARIGRVSRYTIWRDDKAGRLQRVSIQGHPRLVRYRREDVVRLYLNGNKP